MLTLISPAKNLNLEPFSVQDGPQLSATPLLFSKEAAELAVLAKTKTAQDLKDLMHISDALAQLNVERFQAYVLSGLSNSAKPAALTFNGDVYGGLDASSLNPAQFDFAQDNLRILSGLYGLLRPLDAMQPYRLEMGIKFENPKGRDLYSFWKSKISERLNLELLGHAEPTVINLASNEYFKAVDKKALDAQVISPRFVEQKDGKSRVLSFYAKRARGLMARYIIDHALTAQAGILSFDSEGYRYDEDASTDCVPVFSRPQPAPKNG